MLGLIAVLVFAGLVAWGIYLYYKINQLDKIIVKHHDSSSKLDNVS